MVCRQSICVASYIYIDIYLYIYIYTYTHTHMYTYTRTNTACIYIYRHIMYAGCAHFHTSVSACECTHKMYTWYFDVYLYDCPYALCAWISASAYEHEYASHKCCSFRVMFFNAQERFFSLLTTSSCSYIQLYEHILDRGPSLQFDWLVNLLLHPPLWLFALNSASGQGVFSIYFPHEGQV